MKIVQTIVALALLAVSTARGEIADSLDIYMHAGDSCMQQYNTFEALKHYQRAFELSDVITTRTKLADCYYKRANYHQVAELLKNVTEDSLSHESFRQIALSYQKQGDVDSYIYWTSQLVGRFPMDGEMVAGLTLAFAQNDQPQVGLKFGLAYCAKDSTNILVNRAVADAYFLNRQFSQAAKAYDRLLQQGDSTFNTLYSAGMSYSRIDSLELAYKYLQLAFLTSGMKHQGCAYRLGVVCVDTQRYPEGLGYLALAKELMRPDTTIMKAITLSEGEGYYLTHHYEEAIAAWKEHLSFNPSSVATYYNIANAYCYLIKDEEEAKSYYQLFVKKAEGVENPTKQLTEMLEKAKEMLRVYTLREKYKARRK